MNNDKTFDEITFKDIKQALADNVERNDYYGLPIVVIDNDEYAVAISEQVAFEACCAAVEDTLCYFDPVFLAEMTKLPVAMFEALKKSNFDDNSFYKYLIERVMTIENFVQEVIDREGMNGILSHSDGDEIIRGRYRLYRLS